MTEPVLTGAGKRELLADVYARYPRPYVVETGIWNGQGSCTQFLDRATVFAIETDETSCAMAEASYRDLRVCRGDSATILPNILQPMDAPAFFWLDAHLVSEADQENHSPLMAELDAILNFDHAPDSVVLIDDVRMMGREEWPSLEQVQEWHLKNARWWSWEVRDDVIRLLPWV